MLQVKTKVKESKIHGLGLFADEFIPKDTVIFKESRFTLKFSEEEIQMWAGIQKDFILTYGYLQHGVYKCSVDNDRFINHSDSPNTIDLDDFTVIAKEDIQIGEEITSNYSDFNESFKGC
jgi:SET domain-containing protein